MFKFYMKLKFDIRECRDKFNILTSIIFKIYYNRRLFNLVESNFKI